MDRVSVSAAAAVEVTVTRRGDTASAVELLVAVAMMSVISAFTLLSYSRRNVRFALLELEELPERETGEVVEMTVDLVAGRSWFCVKQTLILLLVGP